MANYFEFNGHKSSEYGLIVNGVNIFGSPNRIVDKVSIPYRNGDLLLDTGVYSNIAVTYTISLLDPTKVRSIAQWLLNTKGYCRLEDTYNPTEYRMGAYYNDLNYQMTMLYRYGQATISFDCKPQRYLKSGETEVNIGRNGTITNNTNYTSEPLIHIYGGPPQGTITIGDTVITILETPDDDDLFIDSESMTCYCFPNAPVNQSGKISLSNGFPKLEAGTTTISASSQLVASVKITPRWWQL